MKIFDAPLHQERWRELANGPLGERTARSDDGRLEFIEIGVRADRRFRIRFDPKEAADLRAWLDEMLTRRSPGGKPEVFVGDAKAIPAFGNGAQAYADGKPVAANPYKRRETRLAWERGYFEQRRLTIENREAAEKARQLTR